MFKDVNEFFGILGDVIKFVLKLILFFLLSGAPILLSQYLATVFDISHYIIVAMICGIIILFCSYWIYKIWKMPNLTRSQKWALMNGRDLPPAKVPIKSKYDIYKALFDEEEGNQKS
ncbi:hypothetical protein PTQ27_09460 [Mannheimia sp. AT1]|uniref:Uncharacterized protein n=1 Tax=Mannheimia cairinae TaxID=3025936 RepID=A0ABT5MR92_9PAST|nr:hypothetical protein [Mannheimia cairinae]MDD0824685.1 hypothetical protein [Mannheimia cairinae]MDD0826386.1 hypothetical protein [Mannheimia cairinae]